MPFARRMYLTHVHADVPGDTYFPDFDPTQWLDVECLERAADERNTYPVTFVTLERRGAPQAPRPHYRAARSASRPLREYASHE